MIQDLKVAKFKCFGEHPQGFDSIKQFNVIVGRNNIGKSSLIDLVHFACEWGSQPVSDEISQLSLEMHFSRELAHEWVSTRLGGGYDSVNHVDRTSMTADWVGRQMTVAINAQHQVRVTHFDPAIKFTRDVQAGFEAGVAGALPLPPLREFKFVRLSSDRDVTPESESGNMLVNHQGRGLTNLLRQYLTDASFDRDIVSDELLSNINEIFGPDGEFSEIHVLKTKNGNWEIFLREEGQERIALSKCGSGLKTILVVLAMLHLTPRQTGFAPKNAIFAFEELENNLHPAALRRLLSYIRSFIEKNESFLFLTTHSATTIDFFSRNENAQIVHVTKEDGATVARTVTSFLDRCGVLDDLDVRASDLLQANGVIWVEGPSDRTYLNAWVGLRSKGELQEGVHYQIVFYGGKLLSHLSADPSDQHLLNVLSVNRNVAVLIDRDSTAQTPEKEINKSKKRILEEVKRIGGYGWVTKGREIEDYAPFELVTKVLGLANVTTKAVATQSFFERLDSIVGGRAEYWKSHKTLLAEKLTAALTKENAFGESDLSNRIDGLCTAIRMWNRVQ